MQILVTISKFFILQTIPKLFHNIYKDDGSAHVDRLCFNHIDMSVILRDLSTIFFIVFCNDVFGNHTFIVNHTLSLI